LPPGISHNTILGRTSEISKSCRDQGTDSARCLSLDPDTLRPVARPPVTLTDLTADTDLLSTRDRLAALTALSQAESASRSAAALESIAASLAAAVARTPGRVA
jgi:hypothetical protein